VSGRIALSPQLLAELRLPNASVRLVEEEEPSMLRSGGPRSAARRAIPLVPARRLIGNTIRGAAALRNRIRGTRYQLLIDLEQLPHPDNRIVLSSKVDRLGQPRAELQWRWRQADETNRLRTRDAIARELRRSGVGRVVVDDGRSMVPSVHHHSGTTRMHADPAQGVVDETLRVHGEENLYVVGSSVFPTAGFANPTLTAVALALRLADHLGGP
jgi:choline dehydrogenase-like flavoprotein